MAYFREYPPENLYTILPLHLIAPREGIRTLESENFCLWNLESWTLESGIHLWESGIPPTIEIRNSSSTDKDLESSI